MNEQLMRWKPQPATVIALIALFVALSGSAIAANAINKLAKNTVGSKQVKPDSLKAGDISDGAVGTGEIANGSVAEADLAAGVGGGAGVADGSITTAKLADDSVSAAKIIDATIGVADLADDSVTAQRRVPAGRGVPRKHARRMTSQPPHRWPRRISTDPGSPSPPFRYVAIDLL